MKRKNVFFGLVLAIIFALVFTACGDLGGDDLLENLNESRVDLYGDYPPDATPGPGFYEVGATGPAGGIIIYAPSEGFLVNGESGRFFYLEAMPTNMGKKACEWPGVDGVTRFGSEGEISYIIGNGRKDTQLHINAGNTVAALAASSSFGERSDWFLPSIGELAKLIEFENKNKVFNYSDEDNLFSSSVNSDHFSWYMNHISGPQTHIRFAIYDDPRDSYEYLVHPIRAF